MSETPQQPGWYWDPQELAFNTWLREKWQREGMYLGPENTYRLRRWDGLRWTEETMRDYQARGVSSLPYAVGPTTRMHPITPKQARRGWWIWSVLMVLAGAFALAHALLR